MSVPSHKGSWLQDSGRPWYRGYGTIHETRTGYLVATRRSKDSHDCRETPLSWASELIPQSIEEILQLKGVDVERPQHHKRTFRRTRDTPINISPIDIRLCLKWFSHQLTELIEQFSKWGKLAAPLFKVNILSAQPYEVHLLFSSSQMKANKREPTIINRE